MTKNLLKSVMQKPVEKKKMLDTEELIKKIESGYTVNRIPKHTKKKTFAPSTLVYGHGECPRYWYLAFEGNIFTDSATPYSVANMTSGTLSHGRIQKAMMDSGVARIYKDDEGQDTTEFKITHSDPPIFGYGDGIIDWAGEEIVAEIKTMPHEPFEYFKTKGSGKKGHLMQLLIYMKILGKAKGVLIYENKNTHELLVFPVEVNKTYIEWIDYVFGWLREVRKAWEDKTIPKKNYRSNSKVCKECPVKEACNAADVGEIKIASLEELSETV
jgi:CRISPR/Cas system-associated exonuclease Cas4 (RecB family)